MRADGLPALAGRTIVLTGGSRGIGRAVVLRALDEGANVACSCRQLGPASDALQAAAAARGAAARLHVEAADTTDEAAVDRLVEVARARFGPLDVAIANAGIHQAALLANLPLSLWEAVLAANLTGAFLVARRALADFLASGTAGRFIAVGSVMQHGAQADAAYASSKAGLVGLVEAVNAEGAAAGVRAYLAIVGLVDTAMTAHLDAEQRSRLRAAAPQGRTASPDEVARALCFLASPGAAALAGGPFHLSGGLRDVPVLGAA
jgi:3-oxoacyl-[acyl-carrier protein] reductase